MIFDIENLEENIKFSDGKYQFYTLYACGCLDKDESASFTEAIELIKNNLKKDCIFCTYSFG